jgi:hypothetical protein
MKVIHKESGELLEAVIDTVEEKDWAIILDNDAFQFDWNYEKDQIVYKIRLESEEEILGLISVEDIPKEFRIHIRLIEVNTKDVGRRKRYDYVAGCLFAFVCEKSFQIDYEGYVSLQPKTELIEHYISKYGFQQFGKNLFVELADSERLINKYLGDGR